MNKIPKCPGLDERVPVNEISMLDMIWRALDEYFKVIFTGFILKQLEPDFWHG